MLNRLTEEQKKLIEDNLPFMYWWFNTHHIYNEDTQQDLLFNLCALIHLYDPERASITTFIDMINKSKIGKLWKHDVKNQMIEKFVAGLDENAYSNNEDSSYTWQELVGDIDSAIDKFEEKDLCKYLLGKLKESKRIKQKDYDLFVAYINIGNQAAVARMFKVTQYQITKTIIKIRKEIIANGWLYD